MHVKVWIDAWEVSKSRMIHFLEKGENIALIPGGFQEATIYIRNRHRVYAHKSYISFNLILFYSSFIIVHFLFFNCF